VRTVASCSVSCAHAAEMHSSIATGRSMRSMVVCLFVPLGVEG
jgi:hypothetical protein